MYHDCLQDNILESVCGVELCIQAFHLTNTGPVRAAEDAGFKTPMSWLVIGKSCQTQQIFTFVPLH